jgi:DNA-binding NtrC family response regulator
MEFLIAIARTLEGAGYTVFKAKDGFTASEIVRDKRIGLAFVDTDMPIIDGMEVLREIKWLTPDTQVVLMADQPDAESAATAFGEGAIGYFTKPIEGYDLMRKVEEVRNGSCSASIKWQ